MNQSNYITSLTYNLLFLVMPFSMYHIIYLIVKKLILSKYKIYQHGHQEQFLKGLILQHLLMLFLKSKTM